MESSWLQYKWELHETEAEKEEIGKRNSLYIGPEADIIADNCSGR